jgi:hypothetical protein
MIAQQRLDTAAPLAIVGILGVAAVAGLLWLAGVQKQATMLQSGHPREAFAAVKRAAGLRMQVRKIEISADEMLVLAYDPDMPDWRYAAGNRGHPGHWYSGQRVKEQSWRVSYWTIFGRDWYRVKGPIVEGIIQQNEGPAFDLKPEDFIELPELLHKAVPDPAIPKDACPLRLVADTRVWSICEHHGDPLLVFLQAFVPPPPMRDCVDPQGPLFSGTAIDARMLSRLFGCHRVN